MKIINLFAVLFILLVACKKEKRHVWVQYNETWCADSWYNGEFTEEEKKQLVEKYFEARGCKIKTIKIVEVGAEIPCFACECQSGLAVKCEIRGKYVGTFLEEGFFKISD